MDGPGRQLQLKRLTALAREALAASEFELAAERAQDIVRLYPDHPQGPTLLSEALASDGKLVEAFAVLDQVANVFADDAKLAAHGRNLAREYGDPERAVAHARRLYLINPLDPKNLVFLIQSAIERDEADLALEYLARLEAVEPYEPRKDALLAKAQYTLGKAAQAQQTVNDALKSRESDPDALSQLLRLAVEYGDLANPVDIACKLLKLRPHDVGSLKIMLADARRRADLDAALRWSIALVEAEPSRSAWFVAHGRALLALDRPLEAMAALAEGLKLHACDRSLLSAARHAALKAELLDVALDYARILEEVAPDDARNNAFLTWMSFRECDFDAALETSARLVSSTPEFAAGWRLRAQALAAKLRAKEALKTLDQALAAHPDDAKLSKARLNIAFHHGHFERAVDLARQHLYDYPADASVHVFLVQSHMALGQIEEARRHLTEVKAAETHGPLRKLVHHLNKVDELQISAPVLVDAWLAALRNQLTTVPRPNSPRSTVMIQYWSQGTPPHDVSFVVDQWRRLLAREKLGELALFDRISARNWIEEYAPDFLGAFDKSFHFAMESDIFRIAFASRRPCIYMDIDSWPLEHTAEVLRYGIAQNESLLYFRSCQPWLVNGFFVSKPECRFVTALVEQTLGLDLDAMDRNHVTIDTSFGPTRFNLVIRDLIARSQTRVVEPANAYGCSKLSLDGGLLHFAHEAAVAAVRPPFDLGYKGTENHWKRFAAEA